METHQSSSEVVVDLGLYSQVAVLKATYKFTGSSFVRLELLSENSVKVIFTPKPSAVLPSKLKEEFLNELLDQRLREHISAETLPVRNLIMAHALSKLDFVRATPNGERSSHDSNSLQAGQ